MIDADFLKTAACPWCVTRPEKGKSALARGELEFVGEIGGQTGRTVCPPISLKCKSCGRVYKIEDGLPNFLVEEAGNPKR